MSIAGLIKMDSNKRSDYDDMNSGYFGQDFNERKHKFMKRLVTSIILLFIAASIIGIIFLLRNPGSLDAAEPGAPEISIDIPDVDILVADAANEAIEENLTEEQKIAVELTEEAFTDTEASAEIEHDPISEPATAADAESGEESVIAADTGSEPEAETDSEAEESSEVGDERETNDDNDIQNSPVKFVDYVVKSGDTVNKIAVGFGLKPETIVGVNEIEDVNQIVVGSVLQIPDRDGQMYTVKSGDSLSMIAYSFDMGYVTLAEVNGKTSSLIKPGEKLFIPNRVISEEDFLLVMNTLFVLPAEGIIAIHFDDEVEDVRTGEFSKAKGVYIENETGTMVVAAKSGQIRSISTDQSGLGKHIIISHDNGYQTVYGHLDSFIGLEVGDFVEQGEQIALLGNTGNMLDPKLYFEVLKDQVPVDPEQFF